MFCRQCGKNLNQNAVICPGCGCAVNPGAFAANNAAPPVVPAADDSGGCLWLFLGFITAMFTSYILPIVLIVIWKDQYPKRTKAILTGMIIEIILTVAAIVLFILIFVFVIGLSIWANSGIVPLLLL